MFTGKRNGDSKRRLVKEDQEDGGFRASILHGKVAYPSGKLHWWNGRRARGITSLDLAVIEQERATHDGGRSISIPYQRVAGRRDVLLVGFQTVLDERISSD